MAALPGNHQQFNLKWNNHNNNIVQVFAEQLSCENLVDVTISCQGKFLKAHKMVLSACSPYFQELFQYHQVPHPVLIMNKMEFVHIKQIVDFMYKGEVKVPEGDLGELLLVAESLQVKGLSNVRNKYEKGHLPGVAPLEKIMKATAGNQTAKLQSFSSTNEDSILEGRRRTKEGRNSQSSSSASSGLAVDDDFPATIKVEPPDIKDIDEEPNLGWDSPKLIIDMKEPKEKLMIPETEERKRPRILRTSSNTTVRIASAHLEISDEDMNQTKQSESESSESAKCLLWSRRSSPQKIFSRPRICRIPRPPNAFMIFANEWRRRLALEFPGEGNKDISIRLGNMWKNLDPDSKESYYSLARTADEQHKIKYPGYYYSPKEARLRKGLKLRNLLPTNTKNAIDAFRFVKVFMSHDKPTPVSKEQTSLLRKSKSPSTTVEQEQMETDVPNSLQAELPSCLDKNPIQPEASSSGVSKTVDSDVADVNSKSN